MGRLIREKTPVLMRFSCQDLFTFSECQKIDLNVNKFISSPEEGGISGDPGFKASGRMKLAVFPAKKFSHKTAHFLLNGIFPAALLSIDS
jgi:hypothetical protein